MPREKADHAVTHKWKWQQDDSPRERILFLSEEDSITEVLSARFVIFAKV
jgi:hypothetical protein